MDLKQGYKQTEVGIIPEGWGVALLGDCLSARPSYGINAPAVPYSDRLPVYIRITDIMEDGRFSPEKRVSVSSKESSKYFLNEGDIVFARTGASVGKSYRYDSKDGQLVFAGFLIRVHPDPQMLLSEYVAAYVTTGRYWSWVRLMSMRSGQPGINGREYSQLPMPRPGLEEQQAITKALADVNELVGALARLISKKRSLKRAAMEQLFSGHTRLPGFAKEWETKQLGEFGSTYGGLTGKTKADFGNGTGRYIPFLNVMNNVIIDLDQLEPVKIGPIERQNRALKGDLFFNGSSETPEEVGMSAVLLEQVDSVYLNSFCFGFRLHPHAQVDGLYLAYFFRSPQGRKVLYSLAQGATRYNLSKTAFLREEFRMPDPPEQSAIATVLSDMDGEIAALELRLAKTRNLKRGMMQDLLTGKTRVV